MNLKNIGLIGFGAIGTVYGNLLHNHLGERFMVIAQGERKTKLEKTGATLNDKVFFPKVISPDNYDDRQNFLDLIIVCVKNYHLNQAIEDIRPFVSEKTIILPLLNGIIAKDVLTKAFPDNIVLYGLSIFIDAVRVSDKVINMTNGIIQFGNADNINPSKEVLAVHNLLTNAGIDAKICEDMLYTVWRKWMINIGINQISAITRMTYGKLINSPDAKMLMREAMSEIIALAQACDIGLTYEDILKFEKSMEDFSPDGKTSMLQDVEAKRKTEVEYFSGTAIQKGEEFGVETPVNSILLRLIKAIEQNYLA